MTFTCDICKATKATPQGSCGTGYGRDGFGRIVCYDCCATQDREDMQQKGKTVLYLSGSEVVNWPGTLRFQVLSRRTSRHNIARYRYDVWFYGPDAHLWHGVTYGDNTQLCHCKRTRERSSRPKAYQTH